MKTSKHRAVNSSFYTISYDMNGLGKTKTSPGHIQLVYTISLFSSWQRGKQQNWQEISRKKTFT